MLFASQDMLNFLNPILLKTLNFLKQVLIIMKIFLKMLFQKNEENFKIRKSKRIKKERSFSSYFFDILHRRELSSNCELNWCVL
jgi:hypothetical protein